MPIKNIIEERVGKFQKEDYVYLSVVLIFFLIILWVFSSVVSFHTANINKVFSVTQAEPIPSLDMEQYKLTVQKLNLTIPQGEVGAPGAAAQQDSVKATASTTNTAPDLSAVTLKIFNSTNISGLAAKLAESLKQDGFMLVITGNQNEPEGTTTVYILESKKNYEQAIMKSVRKLYPSAVSKIEESNRGYDIIVTIGNE